MDKENQVFNMNDYIKKNLDGLLELTDKLNQHLKTLLNAKISSYFHQLSKEELDRIFNFSFSNYIHDEFVALIDYLKQTETEFYNDNLHTANLIFNTEIEKRKQRLYIDNVIKKIQDRNIDIESIFKESSRKKYREEEHLEDEENLSINDMFVGYAKTVIKNHKLSYDQTNELKELLNHYYNMYRNDISSSINELLESNKNASINWIESIIEEKNIRDGKISSLYEIEKVIIKDAKKKIDELLEKNINESKDITLEQLKICSADMVDSIFKGLPEQYKDQRNLLEVIIETTITEKLEEILDKETIKLKSSMLLKNHEIIETELFNEEVESVNPDYAFNDDLVDNLYTDVVNDIKLAYVISDDRPESVKLKWVVLNKANDTKEVFNNFINTVSKRNKEELVDILYVMQRSSEEARITTGAGLETSRPKDK